MKTEEKQLRACGMEKEAKELRKKWRTLTKDYQIYSVENDRAYYPYRCTIDRVEKTENVTVFDNPILGDISQAVNKIKEIPQHISIANTLGKASAVLMERFDVKSESVIITDWQYKKHIAKGANNHDDIFDKIKNRITHMIENPDYVFVSDKKEDTVIFVSEDDKVQLIIKLNRISPDLSNTIITIFGCGNNTLKRLKKKNEILYKKSIDKD